MSLMTTPLTTKQLDALRTFYAEACGGAGLNGSTLNMFIRRGLVDYFPGTDGDAAGATYGRNAAGRAVAA